MATPQPSASALHSAANTNPDSKFTPFSLTLSNGANLTGIFYLPATSTASPKPLLVGIHGATCSAYNWDVSPSYTASTPSNDSGVPFVAFNRPNFLDSSGRIVDRAAQSPDSKPFDKVVEDDYYFLEEAHWFHQYIFPALWTNFALPNGCSAIVTTSHSMSVPTTTIAAGLYAASQSAATEEKPSYIWAGMIITGFGIEATQIRTNTSAALATIVHDEADLPLAQDPSIHTPPFKSSDKQDLMLGPQGLCDDSLRPLITRQTTPFLVGEIMDLVTIWPGKAAEHQAAVRIPVLYGLGSHDWIWKSERRTVDAFLAGFSGSERVEGAVVKGSGHAIELSPVATGWWKRCHGWAIEVTQGLEVEKKGFPVYE